MKKIFCILLSIFLLVSTVSCFEDTEPTAQTTDNSTVTTAEQQDPSAQSKTKVDVVLFAGGDNMAGRAKGTATVSCGSGHAYEFKAVKDNEKLSPMTAEFGVGEDNAFQISDPVAKTGGMVPAFCETLYQNTQTPIVAVSCSEANSLVADWNAGCGNLEDMISRLNAAKKFLTDSEQYEIGHVYLVWLQGEADADIGTSETDYLSTLNTFLKNVTRNGVEKMFVLQIGTAADAIPAYRSIQKAQKDFCSANENAVLISDLFLTLEEHIHDRNLLDAVGYELLGADAAVNMASYIANPTAYKAPDHSEQEAESNVPYAGPAVDLPIIGF